jgi:hypothetical protein
VIAVDATIETSTHQQAFHIDPKHLVQRTLGP